jgi:hypothetical protein
VVFFSSCKIFEQPLFFFIFHNEFLNRFIDSKGLKWFIGHRLTYPVRRKPYKLEKQFFHGHFKFVEAEFFSSWMICEQPLFLFLFLREFLNIFIDSKDLKWANAYRFTYPVRKKCFVLVKQSI